MSFFFFQENDHFSLISSSTVTVNNSQLAQVESIQYMYMYLREKKSESKLSHDNNDKVDISNRAMKILTIFFQNS